MTVAIGAIGELNGSQGVVVAADRLVTVGRGSGVEYEDPASKIDPVIHTDDVIAVAVGAGTTTIIDEIINRIRSIHAEVDIHTAEGAANIAKVAYQQVIQDVVESRILKPLGYKLQDLRDGERIPPEIQKTIAQRAYQLRSDFESEVQLLIASVAGRNAELHLISGGTAHRFTDTGYAVIGSGSESARLTLIRRQYNSEASLDETLFTVLEAKSQAEERQGVGQRMDIIRIHDGVLKDYDDHIDELREKLEEIKSEERKTRINIIDDWGEKGTTDE